VDAVYGDFFLSLFLTFLAMGVFCDHQFFTNQTQMITEQPTACQDTLYLFINIVIKAIQLYWVSADWIQCSEQTTLALLGAMLKNFYRGNITCYTAKKVCHKVTYSWIFQQNTWESSIFTLWLAGFSPLLMIFLFLEIFFFFLSAFLW